MAVARFCARRGWVVTAAVLAGICGSAHEARCDTTKRIAKLGQTVSVPGDSGWTISALRDSAGIHASPITSDTKYTAFNAQIQKGSTIANAVVRRNLDDSLSVVAKSNDAAGTSLTFRTFGVPSVNDAGFVAFPGTVAGGTTTTASDSGYWSTFSASASASPVMLLREGSTVTSGGSISTFVEPLVSRSATQRWFSVRANRTGTGLSSTNNAAIYGTDSTNTGTPVCELRLWGGQTAPGTNATFADIKRVMNSRGDSLIYSTLGGTGVTAANNQGLWVTDPLANDAPIFVARTGEAAPAPLNSSILTALFATGAKPQLNDARVMVFRGTTATATGIVGGGLWVYTPRAAQPFYCLIASGQTIPELPGLTVTGPFTPASGQGFYLGEDSSVSYWVGLAGVGVNAGNNIALMRSAVTNGVRTNRLVFRAGDQCPGAPAGVTISGGNLGGLVASNRNADLAIWVGLQGTDTTVDNEAMLLSTASGLQMIARKGSSIPGTPGATLAYLPIPLRVYHNARNQVVFLGQVDGIGSRAGGEAAFLRVDERRQLKMLAGIGSVLSVDGEAPVVLSSMVLDGRPLTDDGRFLMLGVDGFGGTGESMFETRIVPSCTADVNQSGSVTVQDIFDFMAEWSSGRFDFNLDGENTLQDLFDFLAAWFAGC